MLISIIKINNGIEIGDTKVATTSFKELALREDNIEEFLRKNIEVIFGDEETLLIVGQQISNIEKGRSDLIAIDENGYIVLIEIKRDVEDIKIRKEPFEFQAIRYAASYAKIKTPEELVDKIFSSYIEKNKAELDLKELTANEKGRRILNEFLEKNKATKTFNQKQRIILIASSFDRQTISAVSWLISNKVDISCFTLTPIKINEQIFLQVDKILPPLQIEDFYIDILERGLPVQDGGPIIGIKRTNLPRMPKLFEWGILKRGDKLSIKNYGNSEAEVLDARGVKFNEENLTYNQWGQKITGWSSICIYEWAIHKELGKTLDELRMKRIEQIESETSDNSR
jgi:hypothetical protein